MPSRITLSTAFLHHKQFIVFSFLIFFIYRQNSHSQERVGEETWCSSESPQVRLVGHWQVCLGSWCGVRDASVYWVQESVGVVLGGRWGDGGPLPSDLNWVCWDSNMSGQLRGCGLAESVCMKNKGHFLSREGQAATSTQLKNLRSEVLLRIA